MKFNRKISSSTNFISFLTFLNFYLSFYISTIIPVNIKIFDSQKSYFGLKKSSGFWLRYENFSFQPSYHNCIKGALFTIVGNSILTLERISSSTYLFGHNGGQVKTINKPFIITLLNFYLDSVTLENYFFFKKVLQHQMLEGTNYSYCTKFTSISISCPNTNFVCDCQLRASSNVIYLLSNHFFSAKLFRVVCFCSYVQTFPLKLELHPTEKLLSN